MCVVRRPPTTGKWKTASSCTIAPHAPNNSSSSSPLPAGRGSTWKCRDGVFHPPQLPRKEVIQPHLPVRLPCYDFTPITDPTLDACLPLTRVGPAPSGVADFRGVTGGAYNTRELIHRGLLTHGHS